MMTMHMIRCRFCRLQINHLRKKYFEFLNKCVYLCVMSFVMTVRAQCRIMVIETLSAEV